MGKYTARLLQSFAMNTTAWNSNLFKWH